MGATIAGLAVFFVLAQLIDGRVAFYLGLATTLAIGSWRSGGRQLIDYVGLAIGIVAALGVFFVLVGVNGWFALPTDAAVVAIPVRPAASAPA